MKITIYRPNQEPVLIHRSHNSNFKIGLRKGCLNADVNVVAGFMSVSPAQVEVMFSNENAVLFALDLMPGEGEYNKAAASPAAKNFCCSEIYGPVLLIERK